MTGSRSIAERFRHAARTGRPLLLDGGISTALEARGHELTDDLWTARLLLDAPDEIREVHREYLRAGADVIATASYQASIPGFVRKGLSEAAAVRALERSVELAVEARTLEPREDGVAASEDRSVAAPLVAASIGPYGAATADGSEYTGDYDVRREALHDFHEARWRILDGTAADLFACETFPSVVEIEVILDLLRSTPDRVAWVSFSCRDEGHLADGTPIVEAARRCADVPNVIAVGVNCVRPEWVPALLGELRSATSLPLVAYANSGERWDAEARAWVAGSEDAGWCERAAGWAEEGVAALGGCCRIGPNRIRELGALLGS